MSRYASLYTNPQGPGDSRPTALQVVQDEKMQNQLVGKTAVITGVSSGIGIETSRALAATGIKLFLTARNLDKAKEALADFWNPNQMELVQLELSSMDSVRAAAKTILSKTDELSIFIANAGVMAVPKLTTTADGFEEQFATNHLSHFLLFELLKPSLLKASTEKFQSRVVVVSATAHRMQGIPASNDYNYETSGVSAYTPWEAYARSKTANTYMANEIERRYGYKGIHATSVAPGLVASNIGRHIPQEVMAGVIGDKLNEIQSLEQAAASTLVAAVGREWEGRGGVYITNCSATERGEDDGVSTSYTYVSHTYNPKDEQRLWNDSLKMVEKWNNHSTEDI
ncbi:related to reductases [Fusarium fujikuroi IMI 58289]|uniref:Related to reductases n=1 Tax=Gibberella fujikuroi (strain CBS 195.34 / IMI 58289 / NRRL A-6831) TaxID=1279085 RepID=S0EL70_GIBF5|nr:related to reductases [Fusarium fujikuroi IMI 58289]KLP20512.1 reductase [Fusarium fujikuroi]CCT74647.1 related to reductases [Fusarium fujikuroi IMI 58289]SCO05252.1 related to reductases [Fusarium fujikuroi]